MTHWTWLRVLAWCSWMSVIAACGSSAKDSAKSDASSCPDIDGTWNVQMHCGAALVGTKVTVDQTACDVTTSGAFAGFTGKVAADGTFTLGGTSNGVSVNCTGKATTTKITESCMPSCDVVLER
jgi:hypothetical protein